MWKVEQVNVARSKQPCPVRPGSMAWSAKLTSIFLISLSPSFFVYFSSSIPFINEVTSIPFPA